MNNKTEIIGDVLARLRVRGIRRASVLIPRGKHIRFPNRYVFLKQIWRRGYRQFHDDREDYEGQPYWLSLSLFPRATEGVFFLYEGERAYVLHERTGQIFPLTKTRLKY